MSRDVQALRMHVGLPEFATDGRRRAARRQAGPQIGATGSGSKHAPDQATRDMRRWRGLGHDGQTRSPTDAQALAPALTLGAGEGADVAAVNRELAVPQARERPGLYVLAAAPAGGGAQCNRDSTARRIDRAQGECSMLHMYTSPR